MYQGNDAAPEYRNEWQTSTWRFPRLNKEPDPRLPLSPAESLQLTSETYDLQRKAHPLVALEPDRPLRAAGGPVRGFCGGAKSGAAGSGLPRREIPAHPPEGSRSTDNSLGLSESQGALYAPLTLQNLEGQASAAAPS